MIYDLIEGILGADSKYANFSEEYKASIEEFINDINKIYDKIDNYNKKYIDSPYHISKVDNNREGVLNSILNNEDNIHMEILKADLYLNHGISAELIEFLISWEKIRLEVYLDPSGYKTLGIGHYISKDSEEYKKWSVGDKVSITQVLDIFRKEMIVVILSNTYSQMVLYPIKN